MLFPYNLQVSNSPIYSGGALYNNTRFPSFGSPHCSRFDIFLGCKLDIMREILESVCLGPWPHLDNLSHLWCPPTNEKLMQNVQFTFQVPKLEVYLPPKNCRSWIGPHNMQGSWKIDCTVRWMRYRHLGGCIEEGWGIKHHWLRNFGWLTLVNVGEHPIIAGPECIAFRGSRYQ